MAPRPPGASAGGQRIDPARQPQDDLDARAKVTIPFDVAVKGGEHTINFGGESIKIKIPNDTAGGEKPQ